MMPRSVLDSALGDVGEVVSPDCQLHLDLHASAKFEYIHEYNIDCTNGNTHHRSGPKYMGL